MQHIWWVGSMYRYTLSQGVQAGSVLAVAYAYHNISVRTALPTRCMCAACHLSSTVQSGIGPCRVLLSKVPDATEGERSSRFQQRAAFRWGPRWRTRSWQTSLPETLSDTLRTYSLNCKPTVASAIGVTGLSQSCCRSWMWKSPCWSASPFSLPSITSHLGPKVMSYYHFLFIIQYVQVRNSM